jgi:hypothetical protein
MFGHSLSGGTVLCGVSNRGVYTEWLDYDGLDGVSAEAEVS